MSHAAGMIHQAMRTDADLVRLIAENIANAQTSGYRRKFGVQRAEFNAISDALATRLSVTEPSMQVGTDLSPGTLSETREPLDIALSGAGSLVISTASGEAFIRGGRMRIDDQGRLTTEQGAIVLGTSGPLVFTGATVDMNTIEVSADGTVRAGGNPIGQLRIEPAQEGDEQTVPRVLQGYLEGSNVEPVTEMIKLMEVIRHFEASQKAARTHDDLMQQAISDLGKI